MSVDGKHFLVTGGAGFVGSHLTDRLIALGHRVTVLDDLSTGFRANVNREAKLVEGDVRDAALVSRLIGEVDGCFHLAAIASVPQCNASWSGSHSVNASAFVGLLETVAKRGGGPIAVVYASSAAVYGDTDVFPAHENLPLRPISVYGADKASCELHAHAAGRMAGVPSFGVRPFNIYGPRQHASSPYSGVITVFADRLRRGEGVTIYGDGKQTRDFIHVRDVVAHLVAALDKASSDAPVCNVATGIETAVVDVAYRLAAIFQREPALTFAPARAGDIYRSVADTAKATASLGCSAQIDIADGLRFVLEK